jgi:hypothetical protein
MALNRIPFKTSRGVAAYISANVPAGLDKAEIFPHKSSGYRKFPNVTTLVTHFSEETDNPGCFHVSIIVSIRTACVMVVNPGANAVDPAYASEAIVGAIADLFNTTTVHLSQDRSKLADAITAAARAVAAANQNGQDADLALFKVDSIAPLPNATSATEEKDGKAQCWVDDLPFELVVRATDAVEP